MPPSKFDIDKSARLASRDQVVAMLRGLGKDSPEERGPALENFATLLGIPDNLYMEDRWTFSSDPKVSIYEVAEALLRGAPRTVPLPELPDYGLCVHARGSSSQLLLVDRGRRLIVMDTIYSYAGPLGWSPLTRAVDVALERAATLQEGLVVSFAQVIWCIG